MRIRRPAYANVAATAALALSITGGAYAATQLPKNSVTSKQVKNSSLVAKDFKAGQLPSGPAGPTGPAGPQGATGAKGDVGAPGPNLLEAGRAIFPNKAYDTGCVSETFTTETFTVPEPAILWTAASMSYNAAGAGVGRDHQPTMLVQLLNGSGRLVGTAPSTLEWLTDKAGLHSVGWVMDANDPALFELQPDTSYQLVIKFITNYCDGRAQLTLPTISWAAYPTPS